MQVALPGGAKSPGASLLQRYRQLMVLGGAQVTAPPAPRPVSGSVSVESGRLGGEVGDDAVGDLVVQPMGEATSDRRGRWPGPGESHRGTEHPPVRHRHRRDERSSRLRDHGTDRQEGADAFGREPCDFGADHTTGRVRDDHVPTRRRGFDDRLGVVAQPGLDADPSVVVAATRRRANGLTREGQCVNSTT